MLWKLFNKPSEAWVYSVLILVLMEDALEVPGVRHPDLKGIYVLILVLMEDTLEVMKLQHITFTGIES